MWAGNSKEIIVTFPIHHSPTVYTEFPNLISPVNYQSFAPVSTKIAGNDFQVI